MSQQDNWWGADPVADHPAAAPASGPVYGAPPKAPDREPKTTFRTLSPDEAQSRGLDPRGTYQISSEGKIETVATPKAGAQEEKEANARRDTVGELRRTIDAIDSAALQTAADNGWWETGKSGAFVRSMPEFAQAGTDSKALQGYLTTIGANTAFDKLQQMRQNSPTGGALGSVSDNEQNMLRSTIANLDPNLDQRTFMGNLATTKRAYLDMLAKLDPTAAQEYANKAGIRFNPDGGASVVFVDGKDDRKPEDRLHVLDGRTPPDGGGNGGGGGGLTVPDVLRGAGMGLDSMVRSATALPAMVIDPIMRAGLNAAGYDGSKYSLNNAGQDIVGLPRNTNPVADAAIQSGTGALTGGLAARGLAGVVAPGAARGVLSALGRTPIADAAAGAGAGAGSEVARENGAGVGGQLAAGVLGGLAGYGGVNAAARTIAPRTTSTIMKAADDLGVTMMPADVGGVGTRMATGAVGRTLGGIPLAEGAQTAINSAKNARGAIAADIGAVADNAGAGQAVRRGVADFKQSSMDRAGQLYAQVSVPAKAEVQLGNTRNALAEITRGMESNPELSKLWASHPRLRATLEALTPTDVAAQGRAMFDEASGRLSRLLDQQKAEIGQVPGPHRATNLNEQIAAAQADIAKARELIQSPPQGGKLSWEDMQRLRSTVGEIVGQPGVSRDGSDVAALRKLYGALSSDMEVTAAQAGPKALQQFRRASQYWRGRESRIDDVFSTLLGNKDQRSDEAVFNQINAWAQSRTGDFKRVAQVIRSMPADEANTVRATIIDRMGNAKPANQNVAGDAFSPKEFATQWNSLSDRAKAILFPNQAHRANLDKFAMLMDGMKRADQFQNYSNSGLVANGSIIGATAMAHPIAAVGLALAQLGAGKLLASPRFARLVASSAEMSPAIAQRKIPEQLAVIAAHEPALAGDIQALQQHLQNAWGQSPLRAAAEEEPDRRRVPPN